MKSIRFLDRRFGSLLMTGGVLLGVLAPGLIPMAASAATLTTRSITMGSSAAGELDTDYELTFTPTTAIAANGGLYIDFCSNTPLIGESCTAPTGFANTATTASVGTLTKPSVNVMKLVLTAGAAADTPLTITFSHIANPTSAGELYGRIYTYANTTTLGAGHTSATVLGTTADTGAVALSITNAIGVSAAVRETLTFCVSKLAPGPTCGTSGQAVTDPSLKLGEGTPEALDSAHLSTGGNYTQLSTNAASGVVVRMTNNNECGGLKRAGTSVCDITPANGTTADFTLGTANFGVKLGSATGGTGTLVPNTLYNNYNMTYDAGNTTGVTSPFGDELYHSSGPVNNITTPLTFGASISNATPAGLYTATINLVATGTY